LPLKKILRIALLSLTAIGFSTGFAAAGGTDSRAVVQWAPNVFVTGATDDLLNSPGVREQICQALTAKMHELDGQGRLPFQLKETSKDSDTYGSNGDVNIALIPFSVLDVSFDSKYQLPNGDFYHSVVVSGLDIAFTCPEPAENGRGGERLLGVVPLYGYGELGQDLSLRTPVTKEQKARKYCEVTVQMIRDYLNFDAQKRAVKHFDVKALEEGNTWQVSDVVISSNKANKIFQGENQQKIKQVIAAFFTGSYQQKTGRTVYPSAVSTDQSKAINDNMNSFVMSSPVENRTLQIPEADHKIVLDFDGVTQGEVQTKKESDVKRDIAYKAWLKKSPVEGQEKAELDAVAVRREYKTDNVKVEYDTKDIYTELMIKLADAMGKQKQ
jgi:hypothetical protein